MTDPEPGPAPKPKRPMSERQLANLAAGREKAAQARAQKLVPSATEPPVELAGQTLVKVERVPADPVTSIEDIIERSNQRQRQQLQDNAESAPATRAAREVTEHTFEPAVPPEEPRPERRDEPSFGRVNFTPEAPPDFTTSQVPRTLADLTRYLDHQGNYSIDVRRKAPRMYGGVPCLGAQRPIREYMTMADFAETYGGGDYELILYGPPRRGGVFDPKLGKIRPVALTDPVHVTVQHNHPPVLDAGVLEEDDEEENEDDEMQRFIQPGLRRGPATQADAKIYETSLQHEERMSDRQRERERELEERLHTMPAQMKPLLDSVRSASDRMVDVVEKQSAARENLLREQASEERRRAEEAARESRDRSTDMRGLAEVLKVLRPADDGAAQTQVVETAAREREHILKSHQDELRRVTETLDARIRDANARADDRIRDIEARADRRVQEAEQRAERAIREAKDEIGRQIADVTRVYEARIKDEERNHERELRSRDNSTEVRTESLRTAADMRIAAKDEEIKRLHTECDRLRHDLEQVKDLPTQVEKFKATATTLGFVAANERGDDEEKEPGDWKSMVGMVAVDLVKNLPEIMRTASESVARVRAPGAQQTAQQTYEEMQYAAAQSQARAMAGVPGAPALRGPGGQTFVPRRLAFATEDGPEFAGTGTAPAVPPRYPGQAAQGMPPTTAPQPAPQPVPPPQQVMQPPGPPPMPAAPAPPPPQRAAPPAPPPRAAPPAGPIMLPPEQLMQIRRALESAFVQAESVDEVAQGFIEELGAPMIAQVVAHISAEQVISTVQSQPDGATSPLVRREGQKFVRALWDALKRRTSG